MGLIQVDVHATPATLLVAGDEHLDELLRELTLIREGRRNGVATGDHPERLLRLVDEIVERYHHARTDSRRQAEACLSRGGETFTAVLALPREAGEAALRLQSLLAQVHDYCRRGVLLTLPPPPAVATFQRQWLTEVGRQLLDGAAPRAAPFDLPPDGGEREAASALTPGRARPRPIAAAPDRRVELAPSADAPARARRLVGDWLAGRDGAHEAKLVVSELVTNALLHAPGPIEVSLALRPETVRIAVRDGGGALPEVFAAERDAGTGRGLLIVESLGLRWGYESADDSGKVVWVELAAPPEAFGDGEGRRPGTAGPAAPGSFPPGGAPPAPRAAA